MESRFFDKNTKNNPLIIFMKDILKKKLFLQLILPNQKMYESESGQLGHLTGSKIDLESIYILHNNNFFNATPIN